MLAVAREKLGPQVPLHLGEAQELPFPDGAFDAVLCCDSFHHYPKPDAVVQEMRRVLRPGGVCLLADPTAPPLLRQLLNVWMPRSRAAAPPTRCFLPGLLRNLRLLSTKICFIKGLSSSN